jgi:hypothetical protein
MPGFTMETITMTAVLLLLFVHRDDGSPNENRA